MKITVLKAYGLYCARIIIHYYKAELKHRAGKIIENIEKCLDLLIDMVYTDI